jgi:hypothetical protein
MTSRQRLATSPVLLTFGASDGIGVRVDLRCCLVRLRAT